MKSNPYTANGGFGNWHCCHSPSDTIAARIFRPLEAQGLHSKAVNDEIRTILKFLKCWSCKRGICKQGYSFTGIVRGPQTTFSTILNAVGHSHDTKHAWFKLSDVFTTTRNKTICWSLCIIEQFHVEYKNLEIHGVTTLPIRTDIPYMGYCIFCMQLISIYYYLYYWLVMQSQGRGVLLKQLYYSHSLGSEFHVTGVIYFIR